MVKYTYPGPPFNWLGTFTTSQKNAFEAWVNTRTSNFAPIQTWYQIRAQQLRKAAGLLENYNQNYTADALQPTFLKPSWQPGPQGHWVGNPRNDQFPMVAVSNIKGYMQPQDVYKRQHRSRGSIHQASRRTRPTPPGSKAAPRSRLACLLMRTRA